MTGLLIINYTIRIVSLLSLIISQYLIFGNLSSDLSIYGWLVITILFIWNISFSFLRKNNNFVLLSGIIDSFLGALFLHLTKNPFGLLITFLLPIVSALQFLQGIYMYLIIFISLLGTFIGLISVFSLISDPFFQNILYFMYSNFTLSVIIILTMWIVRGIINDFNKSFQTYKEQNELLVSNINELEEKIYQYESQIENLKNEIEQERVAFNVELEKVIKEFQSRKDEAYMQIKSINNELIVKDKKIEELNQNIENLNLDIQDLRNKLLSLRNVIYSFSDSIVNMDSLYKISQTIIDIFFTNFNSDTLVVFLKNEIDGKLEAFIVAGENSEFYYDYKKIELEEMYKQAFIEGKVTIGYRNENSLIRPFYPKEQVAIAVPLYISKDKLGMIYLSYLSEDKYKNLYINEDFLIDITTLVGILIYASIFYNKSINRVIWDDRVFSYSPEFTWEFINNLVFTSKRYKEYFALCFISFDNIFGKNLDQLTEQELKFIKEVNLTIKSSIRESDIISFIGNGVILVILPKIEKDKIDIVCNRINNMVNNKLVTLGYEQKSYIVCLVYPYQDFEINQIIDIAMEKLYKKIQKKIDNVEILSV